MEDLNPIVDSLSDLTIQEREVVLFIKEKTLPYLDVEALILMGSRASRTHRPNSDYDVVVVGSGGPLARKRVRDSVRHESPALAEIDLIDGQAISQPSFLASV